MCPHSGLIPRAILTFDGEGRLVSVESDVSKMDSLQGIEFFSGILIPGLVNAHCHLELSYLKEAIPPGTGLSVFVRQVAEKRHSQSIPERIHAADVQDGLMFHSGIAAVGDICNDDFTFELKAKKSRIHYHNFIELFGTDPAGAGPALAHGRDIAAQAEKKGLAHSLTPHSTYSLSDELFTAVIDENRDRKPLSIHFMESVSERELFRGTGTFAERYRQENIPVDFRRYDSPPGRLTASIPGDTPLLLIHNTVVSEEDIDRIQHHFREVTWVICPRSNDYIEGTFPPVELLRRKGCRIALGTDSLSSNRSLSLLDEMKSVQARMPEIPLDELVRWATRSGAEALTLESRLGSFEVGKTPGAVLIDHIDWERMALTPESTSRRII